MNGFDDLTRHMRMFEGLNNQMNLTSDFAKMVAGIKNTGNFNTLSDLAKSLNYYKTQFQGITDVAAGLQAAMQTPETINLIRSISRQHWEMTGQWRSMVEEVKNAMGTSQLTSLHLALNNTASQVASLSIASKNWELLEEFEDITTEALALNEKVISDESISPDLLEEIKAFMARVMIMVNSVKDNQGLKNQIFNWMSIISFLFMIKDQAISFQSKPEAVTKNDFYIFQKEIIKSIQHELKEQKEYRITKRVINVHHKPKTKSPVLTKLPSEFDVYIVQRKQEWVYINFNNPVDNLPETGWVMKKYLAQPK